MDDDAHPLKTNLSYLRKQVSTTLLGILATDVSDGFGQGLVLFRSQ